MGKKQSIMLLSLLGLLFPYGSVVGPLFVKANEEDRRFKRRVIIYGAVSTTFCIVLNVAIWVWEMNLISHHQPIQSSYIIIAPILYVLLILVFFVCQMILTRRK
jgi:uncharacterized Tic20 family protein